MMRSTYARASSILRRAAGATPTSAPSWATARACSKVRLSPSMITMLMRTRLPFRRGECLDRLAQRSGHVGGECRHLMRVQDVLSLTARLGGQIQGAVGQPTIAAVPVQYRGAPLHLAHVPVGVVAGHEVAARPDLGYGFHSQSVAVHRDAPEQAAVHADELVNHDDLLERGGETEVEVAHVVRPVSYTHLRAHETVLDLVCRL